jgi:arsenate reductase
MRKVYYLSTCSTSKRIISELDLKAKDFVFQDIKAEPITSEQLENMMQLAGRYEALFSRIARKYHELALKNQELSENDYRDYILQEYTFLKRPVVILNNKIYIGSSKPNLEALKNELG